MIITIIFFILIFGLVVISHEFGHYLLARKNNIRVVEFAVGMGPTLFSFHKGETKFSLKALPIGGACIFDGEDGVMAQDGVTDEHSFQSAGVWARISSVVAGPLFNLILAFLLSLIIVSFRGVDHPFVQDVTAGGAAEAAGFKSGDLITKIDNQNIHFYRQINLISYLNKGEDLNVRFERDGKEYQTRVAPVYSKEDNRYYIGFTSRGDNYYKCTPLELFKYSYFEVENVVSTTFLSLKMLVSGQVGKDDVAGPVGMVKMVGNTYEQAKPYGAGSVILSMLDFTILLSVNLGILNLLPFPALDGGRLVFLLVEAVRGKPIAPEKEGMVHLAGMIVLMLLMVFVLFNDISNLFN